MEPKYLYVMLSRTPTGMGKIIRVFTRSSYNHVSLTLDDSFRRFVSFARYAVDTPLAGGYIQGSAERFLCGGAEVPVRIFRVEITEEKAQQLITLFARAGDRSTGLIYDSLAALLSTLHIRTHIPGAYTCLSFASKVLGIPFRSLQELANHLTPLEIFHGDFRTIVQDGHDRSDPYFTPRGFFRGTADTAAHFGRLFCRLTRICQYKDSLEL